MTVKELIEQLEQMPQNFEVFTENYCGDWVEPEPEIIKGDIIVL